MKNLYSLIIIALGFAVIIGTQYAYESPGLVWSGIHIPEMQKYQDAKSKMAWHIFTTFLGGGVPQIVYVVASIVTDRNNQHNVILLVNFSIELFIMNFLKLMHAQERPFWVYKDIQPDASCIEQFGNPSGHSLFAAFFSMYLWHRHFYSIKAASASIKVKLLKTISFLVFVGGFVTIGISRLEVGVHSLN